jgi:hypothetical protein
VYCDLIIWQFPPSARHRQLQAPMTGVWWLQRVFGNAVPPRSIACDGQSRHRTLRSAPSRYRFDPEELARQEGAGGTGMKTVSKK